MCVGVNIYIYVCIYIYTCTYISLCMYTTNQNKMGPVIGCHGNQRVLEGRPRNGIAAGTTPRERPRNGLSMLARLLKSETSLPGVASY